MGSNNLVIPFMVHKKLMPKGGVLSFYRGSIKTSNILSLLAYFLNLPELILKKKKVNLRRRRNAYSWVSKVKFFQGFFKVQGWW